jgi:hypothetical protein
MPSQASSPDLGQWEGNRSSMLLGALRNGMEEWNGGMEEVSLLIPEGCGLGSNFEEIFFNS